MIAVIALLAFIEYAIAAALKLTDRRTAIAIGVVAVVTAFGIITLRSAHTVTAARPAAAGGALVGVDVIAVIALLALVEHAITATLKCTLRGAAIAKIHIAVIAGFIAALIGS